MDGHKISGQLWKPAMRYGLKMQEIRHLISSRGYKKLIKSMLVTGWCGHDVWTNCMIQKSVSNGETICVSAGICFTVSSWLLGELQISVLPLA